MLTALIIVAALVLGADFTYDRVTHHRHDQWEKNTVKRHPDGTRIDYEEFTCGTGRVALLMVHGFAAGPATFTRIAPALASNGLECHVICLPGIGRPMDEYRDKATVANWRTTLENKITDLRKNHDRVWLVGHSLGGTLSTLQTLDAPASIDGLILLAPLFKVSERRSPILSPRTLHEITDTICLFTDITEMAFPLDAHDPELRANAIRDNFVPRSMYTHLFALTDSVEGRAPELKKPTLLVIAPDDHVADPEAARTFVLAATNTPRREIHTQTNSGHVVTWDYGWEETAAHIARFILAD